MRAELSFLYCVSKLEECKLTLRLSATNVVALIKQAISLAQDAKHSHLFVHLQVDADVPPTVLLDGKRVKQILVNLISNGLKFTDIGGVQINVHCSPSSSKEAASFWELVGHPRGEPDSHSLSPTPRAEVVKLTFAVADTGIGNETLIRPYSLYCDA
jgi:signal transduction histidine kinase